MEPTSQRVWTAHVLIGALCVCFVALIARLSYIQTKMRPELVAWSERRQTGTIPLPGCRGSILDRRHRVLAGSQDMATVFADPRLVPDHAEAAERLAPILGMPAAEILKKLEKPTAPAYVVLRRRADQSIVDQLTQLKPPIPGVNLHREPARTYPMGELAAHIIGFVNSDEKGLEGIELTCEKYLHDTPGQRTVYYDARRRAMFEETDAYVAPRDGMHVVLTIDAAIQEVAEREVKKAVEHFQAESGLAIVLNAQTGEVLAMTCMPTFHPATAGNTPAHNRRNRILTDPVEPGSIFKPFVMAAALMAGVVKPTDVIYCHNGLLVLGKRMLHDSHPYGNLTAAEVIAKSSNIGMAIIGQRLGNQQMYSSLREQGFGQLTGIDLPGEGPGLFMPFKKWTTYTNSSVPMGHELAVTPIQIATAFSAIVNGGRLLQPRVLAAVVDRDGRVVVDNTKVIDKGQVFDQRTVDMMREMLVLTVNAGTGRNAQLDKWQVMGKTGTAQVPRADRRGYEPDAYLSSFLAAAPAHDPVLTVLVMIRKPNRKIAYYGSAVSAPVVKNILNESLSYLGVPPDPVPPNAKPQLAKAQR